MRNRINMWLTTLRELAHKGLAVVRRGVERRHFSALWERIYRYHYGVGVHTLRLLRRAVRTVDGVTRPVRRWIRYQWLRRIVRPTHRFFRRQRSLGGRMRPAFEQMREAAKKNVLAIFPCLWHLIRSAVRNYWTELTSLGRFVGPIAAAAVLLGTVGRWSATEYCLRLTYRGEDLGLVESASVYDRGAALARGRVINADDSFEVDAVPTFTMTIRGGKSTLSETEVCDAILRQSGDAIVQLYGLYVDDEFVGAMADEKDIDKALNTIKKGHYDKKDPNQSAAFVQSTAVVEGLYPASTEAKDVDTLVDILREEVVESLHHTVAEGDTLSGIARQYDTTTTQLRRMNPDYAQKDDLAIGAKLLVRRAQPRLQVLVVEKVTEKEVIDYKTKTVLRDDKYTTYSQVTTYGQEGEKEVYYEHIYLDGEKIEIKRTGEKVTKQPVTKVIEEGTKKVQAQSGEVAVQGDGLLVDNWTWPVPVCHNVYQGYHGGHLAIDISSGGTPVFNQACLAANGGKVVYAGWYYGYGYYIKIDHGNGLYTTYSHLNSIAVVVGQKVSNGQRIGRVGNTGNSSGPHLHFEVIRNGVRVNPLNYVKP